MIVSTPLYLATLNHSLHASQCSTNPRAGHISCNSHHFDSQTIFMQHKHTEGSSPADRPNNNSNMLSFAPAPIFGASMPAWDSRPAISSPLSSSPVRATSPLSPLDKNALFQRQTQSSPLQASKFSKFASRQTRPNPLVRKREEAQEARRTNFLQSVRRKAEDKAWQRRDIEGHVSIICGLGRRAAANRSLTLY